MTQHSTAAEKNVAHRGDRQQPGIGKTGMAVVAGMAGAAAGATLGVALSDSKNRAKLMKLATEARDALERFMTDLRENAEDFDAQEVKEKVKRGAKETAKKLRA